MVSIPPGPVFRVASLIQFRCDIRGHNGTVTFRWYQNCSQTNSSQYLGTSDTALWPDEVLTTPTYCWDGMTCEVTDSTNQTATGYVSFAMLRGE